MNIIRVGSRYLLPSHINYIGNVIKDMRKNSATNINDLAHLLMYPNLLCLFAVEGEVPIGLFACSIQQQTLTCHVILSYVSPDSRRKGVFKALLNNIRKPEVCIPFTWNKISFGVMTTNKTMQHVMRASGASPEATVYSIAL